MESAAFNATKEQPFLFWYQLEGSSCALEVQYKTSAGDWLRIFRRTNSTDSWQQAIIRVPEGGLGLRLLASTASAQDVVRIDGLLAANAVGSLADAGCSFETDFCGWAHKGRNLWRRWSGPTQSASTGPSGAAEGSWYVYAEASASPNKVGYRHQIGYCSGSTKARQTCLSTVFWLCWDQRLSMPLCSSNAGLRAYQPGASRIIYNKARALFLPHVRLRCGHSVPILSSAGRIQSLLGSTWSAATRLEHCLDHAAGRR